MASDARALLELWFEGAHDDLDPQGPVVRRWFRADPAFDALLGERFRADLDEAAEGRLGAWCATPRGTLALVLLCDQIARNIHRGSPRAYATDALALHCTMMALARGEDASLSIAERQFLLMPLMHSERLAVHDVAAREFARWAKDAETHAPKLAGYARNVVEFEQKHRAVIERFGRYPQRNAALGRNSTDEERAFLGVPSNLF